MEKGNIALPSIKMRNNSSAAVHSGDNGSQYCDFLLVTCY